MRMTVAVREILAPIISALIRARGLINFRPLFDDEFPTISESKSIFAFFALLFDNLCF